MCKILLMLLLWLFMSPFCLCANDKRKRRWLAMLDCFQTLNNNKINYVCPRIGTWLILTVSQLIKPLIYSWLTENVKRYKKGKEWYSFLNARLNLMQVQELFTMFIDSKMRVRYIIPDWDCTYLMTARQKNSIKIKKGNDDTHSFVLIAKHITLKK